MTRGLQKEQARERAKERADAHKGGVSHLKAQQTSCDMICPVCRAMIANQIILERHYASKHPKLPVPTFTAT